MSNVAVLGPGRVGTLLAVACARAGHRVVAVGGGSEASRARVTALVAGARPAASPAEAAERADLVLLTVPDDALGALVTDLAVAGAAGEGQRVVHVAGARGLGALHRLALAGARVAACHPAMTVPAGSVDPDVLVGVAWAVTAGAADRAWADQFVRDLGGDPHHVPDDRRVLYHAALAVGSNAVGAAIALSRRLLLAAQVEDPTAFLEPLVRASSDNVLREGVAALTGPIVRGDAGTIVAHLDALDRDLPELAVAYRALSRGILVQVASGLDPDARAALDAALTAPDATTEP